MSRRRAPSWGPGVVPAARRDLLRTLASEEARLRALADQPTTRREPGFYEDMISAAADLGRITDTAARAALLWVAAPMVEAALDASQEVPELAGTDAPAGAGLMVLAQPLPPWDTTEIGGLALRAPEGFREHTSPVTVDAIMWDTRESVLDVDLMCRPTRLPLPLHGVEQSHLTPFAHWRLPLPIPLQEQQTVRTIGTDGLTVQKAWIGPTAFLSAAWVMMMTPTLAQRTTIDHGARRTPSDGAPHPRDVTVVDLRPMRQVRVDHDETGRALTHRHIVRGHWTHQPYGPGGELRRLQWVAPYVRGPEDAPWGPRTQKVYAWRR